jgi:hypothetical protein
MDGIEKMSAHDVVEVRIADLVQHKRFQVREKLDEGLVWKYAQGFKHEGPIADEPILVGRILAPDKRGRGAPSKLEQEVRPGALVLLAGYHRVQACKSFGKETIKARIVDTTAKAAQWLAAQSNMHHGLPLKAREERAAFHAYLRAHRRGSVIVGPDGERVSLRDMGKRFGRHHQTLHKWMNTPEFRSVNNQYSPEDVHKDRRGMEVPDEEAITPEQAVVNSTTAAMLNASNMADALSGEQKAQLAAAHEASIVRLWLDLPGSPLVTLRGQPGPDSDDDSE